MTARRSDLEWARHAAQLRSVYYDKADRYYRGNHPTVFSTPKKRTMFADIVSQFRLNLMKPVISAPMDRLEITGWDSEAASEAWKEPERQAPRMAQMIHKSAMIYGDSYALIWPESDPLLWPQEPATIVVRYDREYVNKINMAAKLWQDNDRHTRINIYYEDRVERFVSTMKNVQDVGMYNFRPSDLTWYGTTTGEPNVIEHGFGEVPVLHFANSPLHPTDYGTSKLEDVYPLQDALNKTVADLLITMEKYSMPMRWATGFDPENAEEDNTNTSDDDGGESSTIKKNVDLRPDDTFVGFPGKDTRVGQLPAAELNQIIQAKETFEMDVARISGTPLHYFMIRSDRFPSGESFRSADGRLIAQVHDFQADFTPQWARWARMVTGSIAEPMWKDPVARSPKEDAEAAIARQEAGLSRRWTLREIGFSDAQIDAILAEAQEEANSSNGSWEDGGSPNETREN